MTAIIAVMAIQRISTVMVAVDGRNAPHDNDDCRVDAGHDCSVRGWPMTRKTAKLDSTLQTRSGTFLMMLLKMVRVRVRRRRTEVDPTRRR